MEETELLESIKFLLLCKNDYQAIRLIEKYNYCKKEEIDQKCIDFAEWLVNDYYTNPDWEYKTIKELLEIYKKVKINFNLIKNN